ncbi:peptidoglycan editing factor PgeF [Prochlorococcus marinus]|uniref:peptidoglycan editing factor PgeF n=1 Tax=Prochlorococcus marinus TaxID=1219 RepID=UPI0022B4C3C7|nr:peptidoglycan editing factor PgeF [Prochlorococcus marinus]
MSKGEILTERKGWRWVKKNELIYIQSLLLLENNFNHAFFTRIPIYNEPKYLKNEVNKSSTIHFCIQNHGKEIVMASQTNIPFPIQADCILSDENNQGLWIYTADCIPILLGDKKSGNVAAIHAGWKGLSKNIIREALIKIEQLGCKRKDLIIALGPAISGSNYQVELDVMTCLYNNFGGRSNFSKEKSKESMFAMGCIQNDKSSNKVLLDIRTFAYNQLILEHIKDFQISINNDCTFNETKFFSSWRRDQTKERQWSCIASSKR